MSGEAPPRRSGPHSAGLGRLSAREHSGANSGAWRLDLPPPEVPGRADPTPRAARSGLSSSRPPRCRRPRRSGASSRDVRGTPRAVGRTSGWTLPRAGGSRSPSYLTSPLAWPRERRLSTAATRAVHRGLEDRCPAGVCRGAPAQRRAGRFRPPRGSPYSARTSMVAAPRSTRLGSIALRDGSRLGSRAESDIPPGGPSNQHRVPRRALSGALGALRRVAKATLRI